MNELVKWLKENVGDNIQIITPQFERTEPLEYNYIPSTAKDFMAIVNSAPTDILIGLGFRRWDTMNNLIKENKGSPVGRKIEIPIINSKDTLPVEVGRQPDHPIKLLEVDEDVLLIPGEWYKIIPDGFMVTGLYGEQYPFKKGESDDDIRFGCLPYGIRKVKG